MKVVVLTGMFEKSLVSTSIKKQEEYWGTTLKKKIVKPTDRGQYRKGKLKEYRSRLSDLDENFKYFEKEAVIILIMKSYLVYNGPTSYVQQQA